MKYRALLAIVAILVFFGPISLAAQTIEPQPSAQMMQSGSCKSMPGDPRQKGMRRSCCTAMLESAWGVFPGLIRPARFGQLI